MKIATARLSGRVLVVLSALFGSTLGEAQQKVVIYSSNDDTLHKLVFPAFTRETGIAALAFGC